MQKQQKRPAPVANNHLRSQGNHPNYNNTSFNSNRSNVPPMNSTHPNYNQPPSSSYPPQQRVAVAPPRPGSSQNMRMMPRQGTPQQQPQQQSYPQQQTRNQQPVYQNGQYPGRPAQDQNTSHERSHNTASHRSATGSASRQPPRGSSSTGNYNNNNTYDNRSVNSNSQYSAAHSTQSRVGRDGLSVTTQQLSTSSRAPTNQQQQQSTNNQQSRMGQSFNGGAPSMRSSTSFSDQDSTRQYRNERSGMHGNNMNEIGQNRNGMTTSSVISGATRDTRATGANHVTRPEAIVQNQARPPRTPQNIPPQPSNKPDLPELQNIVSTAHLGAQLDLHFIAANGRNVEYKPKRFAAAIMRIRDPKTTALIFRSGKMVCTGAKSETDSENAAKKYAKTLKNIGIKQVDLGEFKIQNIVASHAVDFCIKLESLLLQADQMGIKCRYEPELFPGLIFRMKQPSVVLLIFASGKIVLTGAKTRDEIYESYNKIHPVLKKHKNDNRLLN